MRRGVRVWLARLAAPAALLLAATVAVLLVRSALESGDDGGGTTTTPTVTQPAAPPAQPPAGGGTTTTAAATEFYRVRRGDTLETIAEQYGTTVEQLLVLNPEVDPVELAIGERIRVQ